MFSGCYFFTNVKILIVKLFRKNSNLNPGLLLTSPIIPCNFIELSAGATAILKSDYGCGVLLV